MMPDDNSAAPSGTMPLSPVDVTGGGGDGLVSVVWEIAGPVAASDTARTEATTGTVMCLAFMAFSIA